MFELAPAAAGAGIVAARLCLPRAAAFGEGDVPNLASAVRWTGSDPTGGGLNGSNTLVVNTTVRGGGTDILKGKGPNDWFVEFPGDTLLGFVPGEQIN